MKMNEAPGTSGQSQSQSGSASASDKAMPKDARVMMAILKDMNILDYEPRVVEQLLEFSYRYISTILEDSRVLCQHARKKNVDIDDVKLAVQMYTEHNLTSPPTRDVLLEVSSRKNATALPIPKISGGLRLPPDRYCLTACNYKLKPHKKRGGYGGKSTPYNRGGNANFSSATGFTMKTMMQPANIRMAPTATAPKIQIQTQASTSAGGQPMFSMTVNPSVLNSGVKRTADQMDQ